MKLLYGTTNQAKIVHMNNMLEGTGIEIISLRDLRKEIPYVSEDGKTPLENAKIKAKIYYERFKIPVFACDTGLFFEDVKEHEQPGVFVRRVNNIELNDEEMIDYYSSLADKYGGELVAQYKNAIHFILDENREFSLDGEEISTNKFILSSKVNNHRNAGFPLDSLSIEPKSKIHFIDLKDYREDEEDMKNGFINFFRRSLGC